MYVCIDWVRLCVCVYVCIDWVRMFVCVCICVSIYVRGTRHPESLQVCVCVYIYIYICMYVCMWSYIYTYIHSQIHKTAISCTRPQYFRWRAPNDQQLTYTHIHTYVYITAISCTRRHIFRWEASNDRHELRLSQIAIYIYIHTYIQQLSAAQDVTISVEEPQMIGTSYASAKLPIRELKVGSSYLTGMYTCNICMYVYIQCLPLWLSQTANKRA